MAQDVQHCQYLATIVETEIWNRECRAELAAHTPPVQSRTLQQICRCLVTFYPSRYFARTKITAWSSAAWHSRTINISAANGRVLLILLPLVRATNDLFLCPSHLTLQAPTNIWQRLKCSKLGIETGARSDKFFLPTNSILNINDKAK